MLIFSRYQVNDVALRMTRVTGLRFLARRRASAAVAVLTLAIALGANTATLSTVRAFLLSSLGVADADLVVLVVPQRGLPGRGTVDFADAWPNYDLLRRTQQVFSAVTCVSQGTASWDDGSEVHPVPYAAVTASFFATMRVTPVLGRPFTAAEEGPGAARVVVIGHAFWQSALGGDSGVVGRTLRVDGEPLTVIGVMPPGFAQPAPTAFWVPLDVPPALRTRITGGRRFSVFGRVADGMSMDAARAAARTFTQRAIELDEAANRDYRYALRPLRAVLLDGADRTLLLVQAGAGALLLLAVLNLAALLLAWGFERRRELAIRMALGAGRAHVVRLLLAQSLVIIGLGCAVGLPVARLALGVLHRLDLGVTLAPFIAGTRLDVSVLAGSAAIAAAAALLAAMAPASFVRHAKLDEVFRSSSRSATLSPAALRLQSGMVVVQSALSVVVLSATVLMLVSLWQLTRVPVGFASSGRLVVRIRLPERSYRTPASRVAFVDALRRRIDDAPEVSGFEFSTTLPVRDVPFGARFTAEPLAAAGHDAQLTHFRRVSPGYLAAMGIPLLRGRGFDVRDDSAAPSVAIVSRALAERFWPGAEPIGRRMYRIVTGSPPQAVEVVGVAGNVVDGGFAAPPGETVYLPFRQVTYPGLSLVIRPRGSSARALAAVRRALAATDRAVAATDVAALDDLVKQANALPRLRALILLVFGIVSVGLVALGSFGVMSQLVASREPEFAARLVFGARPAQLGRGVLLSTLRLVVPGVAAGAGIAWSVNAVLRAFVFGVDPHSGVLLTVVALSVLLLAVMATIPPATRAARVNPRGVMSGA